MWETLCYAWLNLPRPVKYGQNDSAVTLSKVVYADRMRITGVRGVVVASVILHAVCVALVHQLLFGVPYYFSTKLNDIDLFLLNVITAIPATILLSVVGKVILDSMSGEDPVIRGIKTRQPSFDFVLAMRERQATIPQDRSFALYGILQKLGVSLSQPDYTNDKTVVFRELFCSLVAWDVSLVRLLADAGRLGADTPTWVPGFNSTGAWVDGSYLNGTNPESATRGSTPAAAFPDDGRTLVVQGTVIDTVAYHTKEMKEPLDDKDACLSHNLTVFIGWLAMARRDVILPEGFGTLADAVYYVLGSPGADFKRLYQLIGRVTAGKISGLETPGAVERLLTDLKLPEHKNALVDFEYCCSKLANRRILFISSKGYLGSGSEGIAVGDSVALVAGVPLPLILRAAGDGKIASTVVGPAIVAGIANGEAWRPEDSAEMVLI